MASTADLILAIDQGTSSTKALLVSADGSVVRSASAPLGAAHPRPGWVEQDALEVWESVRLAVGSCLSSDDAPRIVAVGLTNQRESLVLWDRATGEPLGPVLGWQDRRTAERCAMLVAAGAGELVAEVSGLPLDPMFSALKAQWLLDEYDPDRRRSEAGELCLGTIDSWLLSRFGGEHVTEIGNASRTQLLDARRGVWDPRLLALFGVPSAVLGTVVASDGPFPAVRGLDPLPDGVPVLAVLGDSHAALFAHAGWRPGVVKATYGTGSSVMAALSGPAGSAAGLCLTVAWQLGGAAPTLALEGNIRSSGRTLTWLAELLGVGVDELLSTAGPSSEGVALVPAFGGLGAPWWDASAVATVSGLTLGSGRPALARAAIESVALQVEDVVAAVESVGGPVGTLLADGGLSRSTAVMQAQADVSGREVRRADEADLSALGAAQLAGVGAGFWTVDQLAERPRETELFLPTLTADDRRAARTAWRAAVARARGKTVPDAPPAPAGAASAEFGVEAVAASPTNPIAPRRLT
ncbi:FGGY-family carbohydrate kinase [Cryptosporangium phraense]|uniref:Glycerol kinase n=1 Tax=Cryptosporangium phraense TaxID=2593070 RepID=A0A545AFV6_9ACTN|nr:FGGY family carbohydrate kinase [Cryptosporangium phraense]TQS40213.1 glycerol kinase [Cryptosporangium phraense]